MAGVRRRDLCYVPATMNDHAEARGVADKVAVVIGGTSGIGLATAQLLVEDVRGSRSPGATPTRASARCAPAAPAAHGRAVARDRDAHAKTGQSGRVGGDTAALGACPSSCSVTSRALAGIARDPPA